MFLSLLKESNKELFLKLCVHAAMANGIVEDKEKEMIMAYCNELNITVVMPEINESMDSILVELSAKTDTVEKNIIILEVLGLVRADGIYDDKEKVFMERLVNGMNIEEGVLSKYNSLLEIYTVVCKELYAAIYA